MRILVTTHRRTIQAPRRKAVTKARMCVCMCVLPGHIGMENASQYRSMIV